MTYKYEEPLTKKFNEEYRAGNLKQINLINELKEVYAKAKILNKITDIVKTGRSLEDFEDVEVTLLAIEHELNYMLEGK